MANGVQNTENREKKEKPYNPIKKRTIRGEMKDMFIENLKLGIREEAEAVRDVYLKSKSTIFSVYRLHEVIFKLGIYRKVKFVNFKENKLKTMITSHSRAFTIINENGDNVLYIDKAAPEEKKIQALIENIVNGIYANDDKVRNNQCIIQGIQYGICIIAGLNIRTYLRKGLIHNYTSDEELEVIIRYCNQQIKQILQTIKY